MYFLGYGACVLGGVVVVATAIASVVHKENQRKMEYKDWLKQRDSESESIFQKAKTDAIQKLKTEFMNFKDSVTSLSNFLEKLPQNDPLLFNKSKSELLNQLGISEYNETELKDWQATLTTLWRSANNSWHKMSNNEHIKPREYTLRKSDFISNPEELLSEIDSSRSWREWDNHAKILIGIASRLRD